MIDHFRGDYAFLSNFCPAPFWYDGKYWRTAEHAYQAMKASTEEEAEFVRRASTPGKAKKAGRQVEMRSNWDEIKDDIMADIVYEKFSQNSSIRDELIRTGDELLVEGNTWHDQYWGDCKCNHHKHTPGMNMLGVILMVVRADLACNRYRI